MTGKLKPIFWIALALVVLGHTLFWMKVGHLHLSDPDTFTYLALARETATHGPLTQLNQVSDLDWGSKFADKNLIFNLVNGLFYKAAGEAGVGGSLFLMSLAVAISLFLGGAYFIPPLLAALLVVSNYLNSGFTIRLFLFRPHVWAIACFSGIIVALLYRRPVAALVLGALFGWGYPLFYLPAGALFLAVAFFGYRRMDAELKKTCVWGLLGVLISLLLHPGFPANLRWTLAITNIAVNGMELGVHELPIENRPQSVAIFFKQYAPYFFFLLAGLALEAFRAMPWPDQRKRQEYIYLFVLSVGLWCLAFLQPRTVEYAIPCTLLFAAAFLSRLPLQWTGLQTAVAIFAFAVLSNLYSIVNFYGRGMRFSLDPKVPMAVMDAIPQEAAGKKVFNCEWETGAYLLYRRPDLRFVDILDPTYLPQANPHLATQRRLLFEGKLLPYPVINSSFQADYVVCRQPDLVERLDRDPLFERLYPPPEEPTNIQVLGQSAVYRVRSEGLVHFVKRVQTFDIQNSAENLTPQEQKTPFWNFVPLLNQRAQAGTVCFELRIPGDEISRFSGSQWLGIGGGPRVDVWRNGTALFTSHDGDGKNDYLRDFVPLSGPVTAKDQFVFHICSRPEDTYFGAALSFWKDRDIESYCGPKESSKPEWRYAIPRTSNCLGNVAKAL